MKNSGIAPSETNTTVVEQNKKNLFYALHNSSELCDVVLCYCIKESISG
jgi:hypothetical protein